MKGFVLWLTGLPGSGKTTIARGVLERLREKGFKVELLDGDEVRKWLSPEAGFSREDRKRHLRRVGYVSLLLARNDVIVLASFVSPYKEIRREIRELVETHGLRFIEVYVKCSLKECIRRDPKGLYKKALRGEIEDMTGLQDVYEPPERPDLIIDSESMGVEDCISKVIEYLKERRLVRG